MLPLLNLIKGVQNVAKNVPKIANNASTTVSKIAEQVKKSQEAAARAQAALQASYAVPSYGGGIAPLQPMALPAAPSFEPPKPAPVTPFDQVLPFEKIFNRNLVQSLAEDRVRPEVQRQGIEARRNLSQGLAGSGGYRLGAMGRRNNELTDALARTQKEQTLGYTNQLQDYAQDWYGQQKTNYYQDPGRFVMPQAPTMEDFMKNNPLSGLAFDTAVKAANTTSFSNPYKY